MLSIGPVTTLLLTLCRLSLSLWHFPTNITSMVSGGLVSVRMASHTSHTDHNHPFSASGLFNHAEESPSFLITSSAVVLTVITVTSLYLLHVRFITSDLN